MIFLACDEDSAAPPRHQLKLLERKNGAFLSFRLKRRVARFFLVQNTKA
jgi:hypothetical protein